MIVDYLKWCDLVYILHQYLSCGVWIPFCDVSDAIQVVGQGHVVSTHDPAFVEIQIQTLDITICLFGIAICHLWKKRMEAGMTVSHFGMVVWSRGKKASLTHDRV